MEGARWTPQALGRWLLALRLASGLSHDALGERVGKTRSQLIDYEKGRRSPVGTALLEILTELGVRIDPPPPGEPPRPLASEVRELSENVDALRDVVERRTDEVVEKLDAIDEAVRVSAVTRDPGRSARGRE
jgi:transcriptional regulator with XRE-family HTH domain